MHSVTDGLGHTKQTAHTQHTSLHRLASGTHYIWVLTWVGETFGFFFGMLTFGAEIRPQVRWAADLSSLCVCFTAESSDFDLKT